MGTINIRITSATVNFTTLDPKAFTVVVTHKGKVVDANFDFKESNRDLVASAELKGKGYIIVLSSSLQGKILPDQREIVLEDNETQDVVFTFEKELSAFNSEIGSNDFNPANPVKLVQNRPIDIKLTPSTGGPTDDQSFWGLIIKNNVPDFLEYKEFIDEILNCELGVKDREGNLLKPKYDPVQKNIDKKRLPFNRTEAYSLLKFATEKYVKYKYSLSKNTDDDDDTDDDGIPDIEEFLGKDKILPYYKSILSKIKEFFPKGRRCGFLKGNSDAIMLELIWNYWHEEAMVNQTMLALVRRFQNVKNGYNDPLANFELDPLRPLNNILWGYIQDAQHRLGIARINYEFEHLYGLRLAGITIPGFNPADRRSNFLQSFHRLIYESTEYFVQADNTIIRPDGFKLLNALRDTHRILAEGAHNQFGDLPTVARIEMLIAQWILSRPEVREFLGGRIMVPYEEPWMDRVDSMKALQGWDNTSITFYRDLAVHGEKIILGIRYGDWTRINDRDNATNWADAFRDSIQRYIHSYYTVTGVDISAQNVNINSQEKFLLPGTLIQQKLIREKAILRR